jgi:archaellum component FlaF (FlaF/FlaG flagellin family)
MRKLKLLSNKKAVSTTISTLLMINVAIVSGVLVYAWTQGILGEYTSGTTSYFHERGETMREKIAMENFRYDENSSNYKMNLTVRNIGSKDVWISAIYVNGTDVISLINATWDGNQTVTPVDGEYHLLVSHTLTFAFADPGYNQNDIMHVSVVTSEGCKVDEYWKATW